MSRDRRTKQWLRNREWCKLDSNNASINSGDYERGYDQALRDAIRHTRILERNFKAVPLDEINKLLFRRRDVNNRKAVVHELSFRMVSRGLMTPKAAEALVRGFLEVRVFDRLKLAKELGFWNDQDGKTLDDNKITKIVFSRALNTGRLKELVDGIQKYRQRDGKHRGKLWK